jgi:hypothetical protein
MTVAMIAALAAAVAAVSPGDRQMFSVCRHAAERVGPCLRRHGLLSAVNGAYPTRLGFFGKHKFVAVCQPGPAGSCEALPSRAAALLAGRPNEVAVEGEFDVCPLKAPSAAGLQVACLAGASRLVSRPYPH